jgi:diacylglycerol kinase (ATP)
MRCAVVFNPSKSRRGLQRFQQLLDAPAACYESCDAADISRQARRALDDGFDTILAAGGDGTLHGVLNGVAGSKAILGVVPLGTSNDYAKALGIRSMEQSAAVVNAGRTRALDAGRCWCVDGDGREASFVFCLSAGVGFVAALTQMECFQPMITLKRLVGNLAFVLAAAKLTFTFKGSKSRVTADGCAIEGTLSLFEINMVSSVGGMPITPFARMDSGVLDTCLVSDIALRRRIWLLLSLQFGARHIFWPDVRYFTNAPAMGPALESAPRRVTVATTSTLPVHLDGEFVGYTPAAFEVLPGAVSVLAP